MEGVGLGWGYDGATVGLGWGYGGARVCSIGDLCEVWVCGRVGVRVCGRVRRAPACGCMRACARACVCARVCL